MSALPLLVTAVAVALGLGFAHWILYRRSPTLGKEERLPRHLAMAALGILALVVLVVALPLSAEVELQVLGLIGIIISGAIALGSNNVLANAMSGLMLRLNRPFLTGDHIRVGKFRPCDGTWPVRYRNPDGRARAGFAAQRVLVGTSRGRTLEQGRAPVGLGAD